MRDRLAAGGRSADRMESESAAFFDRVRLGYLRIAEENADRFTVIDGSRTADSVQNAILAKLTTLL
jgi:dTMP kinase